MEGFKTYRHSQNPKEKELHDKFIEQYVNCRHNLFAIEQICMPTNNKGEPTKFLTDKEKQIVISTIQWLGSPVGQGFLRDCGFKLDKSAVG